MELGTAQKRAVERLIQTLGECCLPQVREKRISRRVVLRHIPQNPYTEDGRALVVETSSTGNLKTDLARLIHSLGGLSKALNPSDKILIKPNYNSPDPPPASTAPDFLAAVVELLQEQGYRNLVLGDCSGLPWHPTRSVLEKVGVIKRMEELGVPVVTFDEEPWIEIPIEGEYLKSLCFPEILTQVDKIIFLPCLKTHRVARFTMSIKLSVGFLHPASRPVELHGEHPEEKCAELNLAIRPDLIILDGRVCFITQGPAEGERAAPGILMASADQVAIDVEGVKRLQQYVAENHLDRDPWELPMIAHAVKMGIGVKSPDKYALRRV